MRTRIAVLFGCFALLATVCCFAQEAQSLQANIPYPFVVEGTTLPPGAYDFVRSKDEQSIRVVSESKGPSVNALVITRLGGGIHTTPQDAHVVFDKVGDTYFLSEIWIPGMDGYLLHATKEKHEHRSINIPR